MIRIADAKEVGMGNPAVRYFYPLPESKILVLI